LFFIHSPLFFFNFTTEVAQRLDPGFGKAASKHDELKVGFDGAFGQNHVSPRGLTSKVCEGKEGGREGGVEGVVLVRILVLGGFRR